MARLINSNSSHSHLLFIIYSSILLASIFLSVWFQEYYFLALPILLVALFVGIVDVKNIYYFFFLLLPFSIEYDLPGGIATDLPSEPLMLGLSLVAIMLFLYHLPSISSKWLKHPISLILISHLAWIAITTFFAENPIVSFKFLLAKLWYVIPFYFLGIHLLKEKEVLFKILDALFFSLFFAISFVMISHALTDFSFDSINQAVSPVFRNHVNYACLLVISLPYLWLRIKTSDGKWIRRFLKALGVVILIAIYLSYTRAAYVALVLTIISYYVIKLGWLKLSLLSALLIVFLGISFLLVNDRYLQYTPDYEKAITHKRFDNLLEATTKMEDISTVERLYRWVAGYQMIKDKPFLGFGPGNFYFFYKEYAVSGFQTYVSNNKQKSGIHNYYLMTTVEQGVIGGALFLALCFITLLVGERAYMQSRDRQTQDIIMAALLSFIIICAILIINDMVEAAKVGPFFFLAMAIIVRYDLVKIDKRFTK